MHETGANKALNPTNRSQCDLLADARRARTDGVGRAAGRPRLPSAHGAAVGRASYPPDAHGIGFAAVRRLLSPSEHGEGSLS